MSEELERAQRYDETLPHAFPWFFSSTRTTIRFMLRQLVSIGNEYSFAVTTETGAEGMWGLWLSESAKNYLVQHMPHIVHNLIETEYML